MQNANGDAAGRGIIKPASLHEMFSPQPNTKSAFGVYGLGFIPETLANGEKLLSHSGDITGWNAQIAFLPEQKSGIVILTNSDAGYYFKSDVLGVWTKWLTGSTNNDTDFLRIMQRSLVTLACFLGGLFVWFLYKTIKQFRSKQRSFLPIFTASFRFKSWAKALGPALFVIIWYFIFYSDMLFKLLFKLIDYVLFTFFSPELFSG